MMLCKGESKKEGKEKVRIEKESYIFFELCSDPRIPCPLTITCIYVRKVMTKSVKNSSVQAWNFLCISMHFQKKKKKKKQQELENENCHGRISTELAGAAKISPLMR